VSVAAWAAVAIEHGQIASGLASDGAGPAVPGVVVNMDGEQARPGYRPRGKEAGQRRALRVAGHWSQQRWQAGPGGAPRDAARTCQPHIAR
jgi:hypothetical protein